MQRLFHFPPEGGVAAELGLDQLAEARARPGWVWLDVTDFTRSEVEGLGSAFDFDPLAVREVVDWTKYPTVADHDGYTFIVSHTLSAREEQRLSTVEYDAFLSNGYLVTFHREDLPGFELAHSQATSNPAFAASPDALWARLVEASAARFRPLLEGLEQRLDGLEAQAVQAAPSVPGDVLALRRDVQTIRHVIAAQGDAHRTLAREERAGLSKQGRRRLRHLADDLVRVAADLENARAHLGNVLDTYRSSVAERTNEVMKVLTVFAAIVLPLSLLAGIYGMNFHNMPELAWRWGYFGLLGVMAVVGLGLWIYFARRGFIGGPRLSAVPGLVGKGLVEFVKLTTKPATLLLDLARGSGDEDESVEG